MKKVFYSSYSVVRGTFRTLEQFEGQRGGLFCNTVSLEYINNSLKKDWSGVKRDTYLCKPGRCFRLSVSVSQVCG